MAQQPQSAPPSQKQRVRVPAGSNKNFTTDSYQNFAASLGYRASNLQSGSTYGFNPITRNHTLLEWAYRGSWLVQVVVDAVADDMTREGIDIESDMSPDDMDLLEQKMMELSIWQKVNEAIKWSRLYGGCLAVIMIDGQKSDTPLNTETVGPGQFKGLLILDRWMVWPHLDDPINELGKDYGLPKYYEVVSDARVIPHMKIHYTRCIRLDGIELPYWQKMAENFWGLSIIEPLYDRLIAFDSTSSGAAQLVYRAHLRTLKIEKLREIIAFGGPAYEAMVEQIRQIRLYQANEGMTVLDASDEFETQQYNFGGLSDVMIQFAQQLSGASKIPLVRLFGQSPAGLNATGDADLRNYYDGINSNQEARLRQPVQLLLELTHRSIWGKPLPGGFNFTFAPLWQLADTEKADVSQRITASVVQTQQAGIISNATALKELRQSSKVTGIWSNITDEDIADADTEPPSATEMMGEHGGMEPPKPSNENEKGGEEEAEDAAMPTEAEIARQQARMASARSVLSLLPGHAKRGHPSGIDEKGHVDTRYGGLHPIHEVKRRFGGLADRRAVRRMAMDEESPKLNGDLPMVDVHGIPITIETRKGERRANNPNWPAMPVHYGYVNGTPSVEGPLEQLDVYLGDNPESEAVWLIEQMKPDGDFDEFKVMLGFPDRNAAVGAYRASWSDLAVNRLGKVRRMSIGDLKNFIAEHRSGQ